MASPRVFVSSTCYDLADERDGLVGFCNGFGFDTALSERGDVFYHPDLHTHTACVRETSNCQLFILIIGGRFGGKHIIDKEKSITNAEYIAAREQGVPIFAFIKQDVLNDHNIWQKNKDKTFAKDIYYPSIDKQEHAIDIFSFIDQVRSSPNNNGFFGFRLTKEIFEYLRKQWSGMFYEYLQSRSLTKQLSTTNETLATLTAASEKIEQIVRGIYKNINESDSNADAVLDTIDLEGEAREFFGTIAVRTLDRQYLLSVASKMVANSTPTKWHDFLNQAGFFKISDGKDDDGTDNSVLIFIDKPIAKIAGKLTKLQEIELKYFQQKYNAYRKLAPESRSKIMEPYIFVSTAKTQLPSETGEN